MYDHQAPRLFCGEATASVLPDSISRTMVRHMLLAPSFSSRASQTQMQPFACSVLHVLQGASPMASRHSSQHAPHSSTPPSAFTPMSTAPSASVLPKPPPEQLAAQQNGIQVVQVSCRSTAMLLTSTWQLRPTRSKQSCYHVLLFFVQF